MKKIVIMLLAALLLAAALCGCGGGKNAKTIDLDALGAELAQSEVFTDTMSQPAEGIAARIYGFEEADVKKCVLYTGTGATAEEIFLVETSGEKSVSALKGACESRIANQKTAFQNYVPEELVKLDDAVLVTEGNYVLLVISSDSAAARAIVEGYTK